MLNQLIRECGYLFDSEDELSDTDMISLFAWGQISLNNGDSYTDMNNNA